MATKSVKKAIGKKPKTSVKKKTAVKKVAKKKAIRRIPSGYEVNELGLLIPSGTSKPVPASKLRTGFKNSKKEINSIIEEIASSMTESYVISEIELSASFSADGKFMGFGVGGAATIKIKITPETK